MTTLAAELQALYRCGNNQFPTAANAHAEANLSVAGSSDWQLEVDDGSEYGAALARFHGEFVRLRDYVQNALATTATNLDTTGTSLCDIAEYYAYEDEETAKSFPSVADQFTDKINDDKDSPTYATPPDMRDPTTVDISGED